MREAEQIGRPLVRAMFLEFPEDQVSYSLQRQFMLGPDVLVAPVLAPGEREVSVYLPAGRWTHLLTGETFGEEGAPGGWVAVPAPVGLPAAFGREGAAVVAELQGRLASPR